MPMFIRAVFFDIDGTLVDSNRYHVEAWHRAFAAAGFVQDRTAIAGQIGKGADNLVPALLPGVDQATRDRLGALEGQFFKGDYMPRVRAFPGARELLARVRASGRQVVLASSAGQEELEHYLGLLDARRLVDVTISKDDVKSSKPDPDIFAVARDRAKVDAAEVVVVGDAPYDMEAARKLGTVRVAVRSGGFADNVLTEAGAQAIYDHVGALLAGFDGSPLAR